MMIEIPYGKEKQTLQVPEHRLRAYISPRHTAVGEMHVEAHAQGVPEKETLLQEALVQEALVQEALMHPIGSCRVSDLARGKQKIVLITSDHTRPLPSCITLPLYLAEIRRGNPQADITILVATGMHRAPTETEMRAKFGDVLCKNEKIVVHDAGDDRAITFFGMLPSGGELWLNRHVCEADLVLAEGFIEPHFFAGFSGGRKSILPGVAARRTVLYNHNARFIQHPLARQGSLEGNPIHVDMVFAAKAAGLAFILNVLLDGEKRIIAAFAGDGEKAHQAGCALCGKLARVPGCQADIVITSNGGYPLDQNIYQTVKGLTTAEACVRPGGVIIMCAALWDGHGGEDFYHWFASRANGQEVTRDIENVPPDQTMADQWQAQILARVQQKARCVFVTDEGNKGMLEDMHMGWAASVNDALDAATRLLGEDASVTVIPDGVGVIVND